MVEDWLRLVSNLPRFQKYDFKQLSLYDTFINFLFIIKIFNYNKRVQNIQEL